MKSKAKTVLGNGEQEFFVGDHAPMGHRMVVGAKRDEVAGVVDAALGLVDDMVNVQHDVKAAQAAGMVVAFASKSPITIPCFGTAVSHCGSQFFSFGFGAAFRGAIERSRFAIFDSAIGFLSATCAIFKNYFEMGMIFARMRSSIFISAKGGAIGTVPSAARPYSNFLLALLAHKRNLRFSFCPDFAVVPCDEGVRQLRVGVNFDRFPAAASA